MLSFLTYCIYCPSLNCQWVEVKEVNPSDYPDILLKFFCYDIDGELIHSLNSDDVIITDNGAVQTLSSVWCTPLTKFSSILTIDISYSMKNPVDSNNPGGTKRIDLARAGAKLWIDSLPSDRSECAITSFNYNTKVNQFYTIDKDSLKRAIDSATKEPLLGTNYNGAFLIDKNGTPGAMMLSRQARFKPIVVFLTDGFHDSTIYGPVKVDEIVSKAKELGATIYCITIGMSMPGDLKTIALNSGGAYYENVNDEASIKKAYLEILSIASSQGTPVPCEVRWKTDCNGGNGKIEIASLGGVEDEFSYTAPDSVKPHMEFSMERFVWKNAKKGEFIEKKMTVCARNNSLDIKRFWFYNSAFYVSDWGGNGTPLRIPKDSCRHILVRYEPYDDSLNHKANALFESNCCFCDSLSVSAGWIYTKSRFVGITDTAVTKRFTVPGLLCNTTGDSAVIKSIVVKGADASEFVVLEPSPGRTIAGDTCINTVIDFTPLDVGIRSAYIEFTIEDSVYSADISGAGAGRPHLLADDDLVVGTLDCALSYIDTAVTLSNTGTEELIIDNFYINQKTQNFSFVSEPDLPLKLGFKEAYKLKIRFNPLSSGTKSAELVITSNSIDGSKTTIPLTGVKDSVNFYTSASKLDLGVQCPDTEVQGTVHVVNSGNKALTIMPSSRTILFYLGEYQLPPDSEAAIPFRFFSGSPGLHSDTIKLEDKECGLTRLIEVSMVVDTPSVFSSEIIMVSRPGEDRDSVLRFKNNSSHEMMIAKVTASNPIFTVVAPSLPSSLAPGETIALKLRFSPKSEVHIDGFLLFEGSPCNYRQEIKLTGISDRPVAVLACPDTIGYSGQEILLPVQFMNAYKFNHTATPYVGFSLRFDSRLLEPDTAAMPGVTVTEDSNVSTLSFSGVPVSFDGKDTSICLVKVKVKDQAAVRSTVLDISDISSPGDAMFFFDIDGSFNLLEASAAIAIDTVYRAKPGTVFTIPVQLRNCKNIAPYHGSISLALRMETTLLEPVGGTPKGEVDGHTRIIRLDSLPVTTDKSYTLATVDFRAMLGSVTSTKIDIIDPKPANGAINFTIQPGKFTIILNDTTQLFNPYPWTRFLYPYPNPTIGPTTIRYEAGEEGNYKLSLTDPNGGTVLVLFEGYRTLGEYEARFNASGFAAGMYFLVLESPTQVIVNRINIVR